MQSAIRKGLMCLTMLLCLGIAGLACAAYPDKPVRLIVTWPPGGSADAVGRLLAAALSAGLGQQVFVENSAGASGNIGNASYVRMPADGYTLILATSTTNAAGPNLFLKLPFHPVDDFEPIALAATAPSVLVVPANSRFKTYRDIVDAAKSNPGLLTFGSGGSGNSAHLSASLFASAMGIDVLHIPYKGNAPATIDLLGGQIDFLFDNNAVGMIRGGKARGLASTGDKRLAALPDVPTFSELGHPDVLLLTWFGLAAQKGTPPAIIERIYSALISGMKSSDTEARLENLGFNADLLGPSEFKAFWKAEINRYRDLVRLSGAKPE